MATVRLADRSYAVDGVPGKLCPHCETWRPLDQWGPNKRTPDGLQGWCSLCRASEHAKNPHKARRNATNRYAAKKTEILEKQREKYLRDPVPYRAHSANGMARIHGQSERLTAADLYASMAEQQGLCFYCAAPLDSGWHIDHKTPFSRGGRNVPANICLCCPTCNTCKYTSTAEEFMASATAMRVRELAGPA